MMRINKKIMKWAAGNWGKPNKSEKKGTEIPEFPEVSKHKSKKKRKRKPWSVCIFCGNELPKVHEGLHVGLRLFSFGYSKKCHKCGAREVHSCPNCDRLTWFLNGKVKHDGCYGCGYEGSIAKNK